MLAGIALGVFVVGYFILFGPVQQGEATSPGLPLDAVAAE